MQFPYCVLLYQWDCRNAITVTDTGEVLVQNYWVMQTPSEEFFKLSPVTVSAPEKKFSPSLILATGLFPFT